MEIELPLADCPQNIDIFGMTLRKDVDTGYIFINAVLQDTNFFKNGASRTQSQVCLNSEEAPPIFYNRGAVIITGISQEAVKVQFLEKRSYQNFLMSPTSLTRKLSSCFYP